MQSRNEMEVKTISLWSFLSIVFMVYDLFFHIVLYIQVKWIIWKQKMKGGDLVLSIGCLV